MTDYEVAQRNAIREIFQIQPDGCLFHFSQCIYRQVVQQKLTQRYGEEDGEFSVWVRCLTALAFVPEAEVFQTYQNLVRLPNFPRRELRDVLAYVKQQWVGEERYGEWFAPAFPPAEWNVRERTLAGLDRTNNRMEGWHQRLKRLLGVHSHIFKVIQALQAEEEDQQRLYIRAMVIGGPRNRRPEYVTSDAEIRQISEEWGHHDRPLRLFLRGIAHHIKH
jgi:hypothetical protein